MDSYLFPKFGINSVHGVPKKKFFYQLTDDGCLHDDSSSAVQ